MSSDLGGIGLTGDFALGDNAWGEAMNANLRRLSFLAQPIVQDKDLDTPPVSPAVGDAYIVADGATGAWAGRESELAVWYGEWVFYEPRHGWRVYVLDEVADYRFDGANWGAV